MRAGGPAQRRMGQRAGVVAELGDAGGEIQRAGADQDLHRVSQRVQPAGEPGDQGVLFVRAAQPEADRTDLAHHRRPGAAQLQHPELRSRHGRADSAHRARPGQHPLGALPIAPTTRCCRARRGWRGRASVEVLAGRGEHEAIHLDPVAAAQRHPRARRGDWHGQQEEHHPRQQPGGEGP